MFYIHATYITNTRVYLDFSPQTMFLR